MVLKIIVTTIVAIITIYILPITEEVLEEIIARRINEFLKKYNNILGNFANHINNCLSKNTHCLVLFINFCKVFETLSHRYLLEIQV